MADRGYKVVSIVACLILGMLGGAMILGGLAIVFQYYLHPTEHPADSRLYRMLGLSLFLLPAAWTILLARLFRATPSWLVPLGLAVPLVAAGGYTYPIPILSTGLVLLGGCAYVLGLAGAWFVRSKPVDNAP